MSNAATSEEPAATLPMFYRAPRPLDSSRHAELALRDGGNYAFAASTNSVPLNAIEFLLASKHYPIVFTAGAAPMPVAVLGLRDRQNLFVDAAGQWTPGTYIPAYVRRYPFIFMELSEGSQLVLCVDEASELVVRGGPRCMFEGKEMTDHLKAALDFCTAFQAQHNATREFAEAVAKADLLVENRAQITLRDGARFAVAGFRVIDELRFNALPDETFLAWRKKGWLPLVYLQLISAGNWAQLVDRTAARPS